jgi:hypothetical protein
MKNDKTIQFNEAKNQLLQTTDSLGKPIDTGIFETVVILNLLGFNTSQSCEGHDSWGNSYPWVDIKPIEDDKYFEAKESLKSLTSKLIQSNPDDPTTEELSADRYIAEEKYQKPTFEIARKMTLLISKYYDNNQSVPYENQIYVNYSGSSLRLQSHGSVYQSTLISSARNSKLKEYQYEMSKFTEFLLDYWNNIE